MRTKLTVLRWSLAIVVLGLPGVASADNKTVQKPSLNTQALQLPIPLADHPQGQAMMAEAMRRATLASVQFKFLDKTYEKDIYATDPFGNKYRVSCVRFKATSGFGFAIDTPKFKLDKQGLRVEQNIARITANGLKFKFQLGPCVEITAGFGISLSDVNFVYKARPFMSIQDGGCKLVYNQDPEQLRVAIGGMNITGVQNDLDKLAKDAVREGINFTLDGAYGSLIRNELSKVTAEFCGRK